MDCGCRLSIVDIKLIVVVLKHVKRKLWGGVEGVNWEREALSSSGQSLGTQYLPPISLPPSLANFPHLYLLLFLSPSLGWLCRVLQFLTTYMMNVATFKL
jgi:hypothetical protein